MALNYGKQNVLLDLWILNPFAAFFIIYLFIYFCSFHLEIFFCFSFYFVVDLRPVVTSSYYPIHRSMFFFFCCKGSLQSPFTLPVGRINGKAPLVLALLALQHLKNAISVKGVLKNRFLLQGLFIYFGKILLFFLCCQNLYFRLNCCLCCRLALVSGVIFGFFCF